MTRWALALLLSFVSASSAHAQASPHRVGTGAAGSSGASHSGAVAAPRTRQTWTVDTSRSKLTFSVRHMIDRVEGRFDIWSGKLTVPSDRWTDGVADITIQTASINTDNRARDKHLRSSDFFDAARYPTITFKSSRIARTGDSVTVAGNLTMRGITKPVVLTGKFLGATAGPPSRIAFKVGTTLNRLDYDVAYNRLVEGGGTVVGNEVTIEIALVAVRQS
jgi:polyisoprenoid-binding protein YceI